MYQKKEKIKGIALIALILIIILVIIIGSAIIYIIIDKKDNNIVNNNESTIESTKNSMTDALAGLYPDGGELIELKMGTTIDGVETALCTVKLPSKNITITEIYNYTLTDQTLKNIIKEEPEILQKAHSMIVSSNFGFSIINDTIDNIKSTIQSSDDYEEVCKESGDIGTDEHPAFYLHYMLDDITNFIYLNYQINDSYILRVSYDIKGDSDREFINEIGGTKQLMQNLYNVINVIE